MTKKIVKKEFLKDLRNEEWYYTMIDESKAIIVERRYNAAIEMIQGKWELGKRILDERGNFERFGYGKKVVETVAKDLNVSRTELFYCLQFVEKYPELSVVLDSLGKNMSWTKIKKEKLPEKNKEKDTKHYMTCIIDKDDKIIWIKEEYKDFKIKYK